MVINEKIKNFMIQPDISYLVMMDMDSTLIENEVIDDLASAHGVGQQVKEITEAAMRGELDFAQSLKKRVALLAGADELVISKVQKNIRITPGAQELILKFRELNFKTCVVSGGFDVIVEKIVENLGIDDFAANRLEIIDGRLTGQLLGEIIDAAGKRATLLEMAQKYGISLEHTIAIGDGANDLPMIDEAAIGIAFNAKPALKEKANLIVDSENLQDVLKALKIN